MNKVYTQTFEKKNDIDCFRFKSGGGNFKVTVWFIPGNMSNKDDYDLDERGDMSYGLYGKWSLDGGAPQYAFGADGIMTYSLYTPTAYDTEGEDYTVSGDYIVQTIDIGKIAAGKEVGLVFSGQYKGSYKFKVAGKAYVVRKSIKKATVSVAAGTYSGSAVKPKVTVKLGGATLKNGTDYSVKYSNNINVGSKAVAKITGIGKYKDTVNKTFTIKKRSLTNSVNITLKQTSFSYSGQAKKPGFSIYLLATNNIGSIPLFKNTDYTFKYENNIQPGTAKLIVTGKGNYTGTATRTFKIEKLNQPVSLKKTELTVNYDKVGTTARISVVGRKENAKLTYSSSNTKVAVVKDGVVTIKGTGTATIKVTLAATKHYKAKALSYKVTVLKKQTITTGIANGAKIAYTTKPVPIKAAVKTGNGKLTYKSSDTSVVKVDGQGNLILKDATKLGKATITITAAKTSAYAKATKTITITTQKGKPVLTCGQLTQTRLYNEAPFALGITADEPVELTYQLDSPDLASVGADGIVTLNPDNITGNMTLNITAQSKGTGFFKESDPLTVKLDIAVISINDPSIYMKQDYGSTNCTLFASAHMMRRKAIRDGRTDWDLIDEDAINDENSELATALWNQGIGLKGEFTYQLAEGYTFHGSSAEVPGMSKERLIELLKDHPEGIACYDRAEDASHAVLVTGYDENTGEFYCVDSDPGQPKGFISLSESLIGDHNGNSQDAVLASIDRYWYLY